MNLFFYMRVGGKYLVRLKMGLFGITPERIWLNAGSPDQIGIISRKDPEFIEGNPQRLYAKLHSYMNVDDIVRHSQ